MLEIVFELNRNDINTYQRVVTHTSGVTNCQRPNRECRSQRTRVTIKKCCDDLVIVTYSKFCS